jgi:hypothetical protein
MTDTRNSVEVIDISPTLRIRIEYDDDPMSPAEWDNVGQIAYSDRSRNTLGTEGVDSERMREIQEGLHDGSLIGLPVYAYVHGGSTISTGAFSCQWDSGQSGFVYCTKEKAIAEFGKKILTAKVREKVLKCLTGQVDTFAEYLRGEVYGYIIERVTRDEDDDITDTEELSSCWGFFGEEYCIAEARASAKFQLVEDLEEELEKAEWAARGAVTA